jgi:16S rRNA A1518/A1519 N6-dimethyltransferase RsmA/KsgA/DIM1 with predicted DNA glycosylase/AP lyase activity
MMDFTLVLSADDLKGIDAAVGELPYRIAAPIVQKINSQILEQSKKASEEVVDRPTPTP